MKGNAAIEGQRRLVSAAHEEEARAAAQLAGLRGQLHHVLSARMRRSQIQLPGDVMELVERADAALAAYSKAANRSAEEVHRYSTLLEQQEK